MAPNTPISVIELNVQLLDGYLYVSSKDVPGLHLCGGDVQKLSSLIGPAIKRLFKLNQNIDIECEPTVSPCDLFDACASDISKAHKRHGEMKHYVMYPSQGANVAYG